MLRNDRNYNAQTVVGRIVTYCLFTLFLSLVIMPVQVQAIDLSEASKSVVKLFVTRQAWDMRRPWAKSSAQKIVCSGFFIAEGILTNAHCIADATYIQIEFPGIAEKADAQIKAVNHQVDLALVELIDSSLKPDVKEIAFDALPELREKVVTVGYPTGGDQVSYTEGVVSRIDMMIYTHSNMGSLMVQTDAAINSGNSGGPVFSDRTGASLGVATQRSRSGQSIGYFVPAPVINQFIKDLEDDEVNGMPGLGVYMQPMENPSFRRSMDMGAEESGVRILLIGKGSSADGLLEIEDVVMSIEGHPVFNDGRVPFRGDGKISMGYYVMTRQVGEEIELTIKRNGKVKKINVLLKPVGSTVIPKMPQFDQKPRYFEVGGLVFRAVEPRYFLSLGKNTPISIRQYIGVVDGEIEGMDELVIVSDIYDVAANKGYSGRVENTRVMKVNGKEIANLDDVRNAFKSVGDRKFYEIEFENRARVILDIEQVAAQQDLIRQRYDIAPDLN